MQNLKVTLFIKREIIKKLSENCFTLASECRNFKVFTSLALQRSRTKIVWTVLRLFASKRDNLISVVNVVFADDSHFHLCVIWYQQQQFHFLKIAKTSAFQLARLITSIKLCNHRTGNRDIFSVKHLVTMICLKYFASISFARVGVRFRTNLNLFRFE